MDSEDTSFEEKMIIVLQWLKENRLKEPNNLTAIGIRKIIFNNKISALESEQLFDAIEDNKIAERTGNRSIKWNQKTDEYLNAHAKNKNEESKGEHYYFNAPIGAFIKDSFNENKGNQELDLNTDFSSDKITNTSNANSQKSFWQKIFESIWSKIVLIALSLLIAYLIYYFGWN